MAKFVLSVNVFFTLFMVVSLLFFDGILLMF